MRAAWVSIALLLLAVVALAVLAVVGQGALGPSAVDRREVPHTTGALSSVADDRVTAALGERVPVQGRATEPLTSGPTCVVVVSVMMEDGAPVGGAHVSATWGKSGGILEAQTGVSGACQFHSVPIGRLVIEAKYGNLRGITRLDLHATPRDSAVSVVLSADRPEDRLVVIEVVDSAGCGIPDVLVELSTGSGALSDSARTGADGCAAFSSRIRGAGYATACIGDSHVSAGFNADRLPEEGFHHVVLSLGAPAVLRGQAIDDEGVAVDNVRLEVWLSPTPSWFYAGRFQSVVTTDHRGRFEILGLAPGCYHVVPSADAGWTLGGGRELDAMPQVQCWTVAAGEQVNVELRLTQCGTVKGCVAGADVAEGKVLAVASKPGQAFTRLLGARVQSWLERAESHPLFVQRCNVEQGRFRLSGLRRGWWVLKLEHGQLCGELTVFVDSRGEQDVTLRVAPVAGIAGLLPSGQEFAFVPKDSLGDAMFAVGGGAFDLPRVPAGDYVAVSAAGDRVPISLPAGVHTHVDLSEAGNRHQGATGRIMGVNGARQVEVRLDGVPLALDPIVGDACQYSLERPPSARASLQMDVQVVDYAGRHVWRLRAEQSGINGSQVIPLGTESITVRVDGASDSMRLYLSGEVLVPGFARCAYSGFHAFGSEGRAVIGRLTPGKYIAVVCRDGVEGLPTTIVVPVAQEVVLPSPAGGALLVTVAQPPAARRKLLLVRLDESLRAIDQYDCVRFDCVQPGEHTLKVLDPHGSTLLEHNINVSQRIDPVRVVLP